MTKLCVPAVVAFVLLVFAPPAYADFVLSFTPDGGAADFVLNEGSFIEIPVYIVEFDTAQLANEGLFSQGVQINYSAGPQYPTVTSAVWNPAFDLGEPFNYSYTDNASGAAGLEAAIGFTSDPVLPSGTPASILLGHFTFSGGSDGTSTVLTTSSPDPSRDMFLSGTGDVLDDDVFATTPSATLSVSAVPEPSSAAMLIAGCVASYACRSRLRKSVGGQPQQLGSTS